MLEDPAHQDVARWGKDGDTFVVVEVGIDLVPQRRTNAYKHRMKNSRAPSSLSTLSIATWPVLSDN